MEDNTKEHGWMIKCMGRDNSFGLEGNTTRGCIKGMKSMDLVGWFMGMGACMRGTGETENNKEEGRSGINPEKLMMGTGKTG